MRNFIKIIALSAILAGSFIAIPAQAWWGGGWPGSGWGGPGGWGSPGGWGGPWGGPGRYGSWNDDWMDGTGWGDMTFSTSMGGRGYGRGYDRSYHHPYWGGYPYGGYPGWGGPGGYYGHPYGGGWGGPGGYYGGPGPERYSAPPKDYEKKAE